MTTTPKKLLNGLLDAGIPVVPCRHCPGYGRPGKCKQDGHETGQVELHMPRGWNRMSAEDAREYIEKKPPKGDVVWAMVAGHGLDVVDVDTKNDGSLENIGADYRRLGRNRTPSGGYHDFVISTGIGKISPFKTEHGMVGDYAGGTEHGGSRLPVYLPGSVRPKYPNGKYTIEEPLDLDRLLVEGPDPRLVAVLQAAGGTRFGEGGNLASTSAEVAEFLAEHSGKKRCEYGRAALAGFVEGAPPERGDRHNWGVRAARRGVQLIRAGCWSAADLDAVAERFGEVNPDESFDPILQWALANPAKGAVKCRTRGHGLAEEAEEAARIDVFPAASGEDASLALENGRNVFRKWLGDGYDMDMFHLTAAARAIERMRGVPLWIMIVGGSSDGKTETVCSLKYSDSRIMSTLSGEAALLSGTPVKEWSKGATGGLLRELGERGMLVLKDFTSILSLNNDAKNGTLAALREIYDGQWTRELGTEGGVSLTWTGRLGFIAAVTSDWDAHHQVIAAMGPRMVLKRLDSADENRRTKVRRQALANAGQEAQMHDELAEAMRSVMAAMDPDRVVITLEDKERIGRAADLATLARTPVQKDFRGTPQEPMQPEMSPRLTKQLRQVAAGAMAVGMAHDEAVDLAIVCARDCLPPLRLLIIDDLAALRAGGSEDIPDEPPPDEPPEEGELTTTAPQGWAFTDDVRWRIKRPRTTVDNELQALALLEVVDVREWWCLSRRGIVQRWIYRLADRIDPGVFAPAAGTDS